MPIASPHRNHITELSSIVLCGGRSQRMGRSKAWLPLGEEVLLQRVVRIVRSCSQRVVVVAAVGQALPPLPEEVPILRDPQPDRGPLQGLAVGLAAVDSGYAFACACDMPFLEPALMGRLQRLAQGWEAAVPEVGGHLQPLAAVYRSELVSTAERLLSEGERRVQALARACRSRRCSLDERPLRNLNTWDDYRAALAELGYSEPS